MATLIAMVAFLVLLLTMQVALTHATARLVGAENATWKRAVAVVLILTAWSALWIPVFQYLETIKDASFLLVFLPVAAFGVFSILLIYQAAYRLRKRQVLGFVLLQIVLVGTSYAVLYPMKWYVFEAFKIPTNSMSPTVSGRRLEGPCPECGGIVVMTVDDARDGDAWRQVRIGACIQCAKDWNEAEFKGEPFPDDRIIAAKWYEPRRWDAVVFRNPVDPKVNYLKRIVGMPGEEIIIGDDGFLIVDGKRIEPPPEFSKLRYTTLPHDKNIPAFERAKLWGTPARPMKLGPDEFFVLGDNTHRALDARFWGPVKRDAIIGTVTLIYWPPSRWRIFK
jgi:signal peptidase I